MDGNSPDAFQPGEPFEQGEPKIPVNDIKTWLLGRQAVNEAENDLVNSAPVYNNVDNFRKGLAVAKQDGRAEELNELLQYLEDYPPVDKMEY